MSAKSSGESWIGRRPASGGAPAFRSCGGAAPPAFPSLLLVVLPLAALVSTFLITVTSHVIVRGREAPPSPAASFRGYYSLGAAVYRNARRPGRIGARCSSLRAAGVGFPRPGRV